MGGICQANRGYPIIESGPFEYILPTEIKPYEMKSNLLEVQEMCATKIQALFRGHQKKELEQSYHPDSKVAVKTDQVPEIFHHEVSKVMLQLGAFDYSKCQSIPGAKSLCAYQFIEKGGIYIGQWKDHKRNGKGKHIFLDGSIYEGSWKDDKANGYGRLIMTNGDYYIGEWKNDKNDGKGIYIHSDKSRYEGEWKEDHLHGKGKEIWADESAYFEGQFVMGVKDGYGIYRWADGSSYDGEFKNGFFSGQGTYCWSDGSKYKGQWSNNKMNGYGEMNWVDKRKYIGELQGQQEGGVWRILLV
ncbi:unnamed protein product [Paramecium primaurelia]|uniref:MORN repeat protein n=1 Tax=Paramecium primaurelia TaxID=5886 RepID=A0A8S1NZ14_PARPR|nr:unnamed protein product [Paramecium primaurelia]